MGCDPRKQQSAGKGRPEAAVFVFFVLKKGYIIDLITPVGNWIDPAKDHEGCTSELSVRRMEGQGLPSPIG